MRSELLTGELLANLFQDSKTNPRPLQDKMAYPYRKSRMPSKADLSTNWREPKPAAPTATIAAAAGGGGGGGPAARAKAAFKPQTKGFTVFHKKAPLVNPYPIGRLWHDLELYQPQRGGQCLSPERYKVGLKCELCNTTVRKSIFPQALDTCGHIFCAKCIHEHYTVAGKKQCPTCSAYIREADDPKYCSTCHDSPCTCHDDYYGLDSCCPGCYMGLCNCREEENDRYHEDDEDRCPHCGPGCDGSCGSLPCGCIDTCRGRCDNYSDCGW